MEGDERFLDMLNFGVSPQVPHSPVGVQEMPPTQEVSASAKAKSTKGKNWSSQEDELLVAAWLHTSLDAVIGTDQSSNSYWGRIYDYYSTRKKVSWPVRVQNAITCRWSTINKQVSKFCGYYQQILNRNQSGVTIAQQVRIHLFSLVLNFHMFCESLISFLFVQQAQALVLYKSKDPKNRPFALCIAG